MILNAIIKEIMNAMKTHVKHKNNQNDNKKTPENPKIPKEDKYKCLKCGKTYRYKSGLSRHKKICTVNTQQHIIKENTRNNYN